MCPFSSESVFAQQCSTTAAFFLERWLVPQNRTLLSNGDSSCLSATYSACSAKTNTDRVKVGGVFTNEELWRVESTKKESDSSPYLGVCKSHCASAEALSGFCCKSVGGLSEDNRYWTQPQLLNFQDRAGRLNRLLNVNFFTQRSEEPNLNKLTTYNAGELHVKGSTCSKHIEKTVNPEYLSQWGKR